VEAILLVGVTCRRGLLLVAELSRANIWPCEERRKGQSEGSCRGCWWGPRWTDDTNRTTNRVRTKKEGNRERARSKGAAEGVQHGEQSAATNCLWTGKEEVWIGIVRPLGDSKKPMGDKGGEVGLDTGKRKNRWRAVNHGGTRGPPADREKVPPSHSVG